MLAKSACISIGFKIGSLTWSSRGNVFRPVQLLPSNVRKHHSVYIALYSIYSGAESERLYKSALLHVATITALGIITGKSLVKKQMSADAPLLLSFHLKAEWLALENGSDNLGYRAWVRVSTQIDHSLERSKRSTTQSIPYSSLSFPSYSLWYNSRTCESPPPCPLV